MFMLHLVDGGIGRPMMKNNAKLGVGCRLRGSPEVWDIVGNRMLLLSISAVALAVVMPSNAHAQQTSTTERRTENIAPLWKLHIGSGGEVSEERSGRQIKVTGAIYSAHGPVGNAIQFDG